MKNSKLITLFVLILALMLSLAACSGTESIEEAVEEAAAEVEETVEEAEAAVEEVVEEVAEETTEEAAEEVVEEAPMGDYDAEIYGNISEIDLEGAEVVFWHRYDSGSRQEEIDRIIADFNATNEYGITIIGDAVGGYGDIYDKMIAGLTTGDVPGLVVAYQNQAAAYQVADGLVSLDAYANNETYGLTGDDKDDFFASFLASDHLPQFGGEAYGFPAAGRSMEVLFFNSDWLAELGYDAPPATPDEFAEMVCAAAEQPFSKNESGFSTGMELSTDASAVASLIFARGGDIFDYETGTFTYDTEEALAATTLIQELVADGCITEIAENYGDQTDFGNGKTLFTTSSSSGLPYYISAVDDGEVGGFAWSVAPFPYTGAEPVQNIYGGSVSVVKTDPATQLAAWLFLQHWTSAANQATWAEASNYFPARQSVAAGMSDYMVENEAYGTAFDLLQYGKAEAPVAGYDNVRDAVEQAFINIVFGGADAATTLADLELEANEVLAESAPDGAFVAPETTDEVVEEAAMEYDAEVYGDIDNVDLDGTEVVFWHRYDSGSRQEEIDRIIADFNATNEYGITIIGDAVGGYGDIYDKMIAGLTTGDVPGLVVAYQNQAAAYQVADGLVSLDAYANNETYGLTGDDKDDFFASFLASDHLPQFGGEAYGFPAAGRSMEVLFFNSDWLAELGYDAPPATPDEFAEMVCAAAEQPFSKNESGFSTGMELSTDASAVASLIFARGGDIFDYETGTFTYDTEEALAATTLIQELVADGCITEIAENYGDQTDFGNGKTLFTTSSSSGLPYYISAVDDGEVGGFAWSVAPFPYTGAEPVQNIYGGSVSVVRTDPATQLAAWLFLQHWTSAANQATWAEASNYFPARQSVADGMSDYMVENAAYGTAFDLLQYGKAEAPVAGYDNVRDAVEQAFIDIVFGGADAATTLADLELEANEILAESAP